MKDTNKDLRIEALALAVEGRGLPENGIAEDPAVTVERAKAFLEFLLDQQPPLKPGTVYSVTPKNPNPKVVYFP